MVGTFMTALAMTLGLVLYFGRDNYVPPASPPRALDEGPVILAPPNAGIDQLQAHLRKQPRDYQGWARLGVSLLRQGQDTVDHTLYSQAGRALSNSLRIESDYNDVALRGQAQLAYARNDYPGALRWADQALSVNARDRDSNLLRIDALISLGRYDEALLAAKELHAMDPSAGSVVRLARLAELGGNAARAKVLLAHAAEIATSKPDRLRAFTAQGDLALRQGDFAAAATAYREARRVDSTDPPAVAGTAQALFAQGRLATAIQWYRDLAQRVPEPQYVAELGDLYTVAGKNVSAAAQYDVVSTWQTIASDNGVRVTMDLANFAADHGKQALALRLARAEWKKRHSIEVADAVAWALHVSGQDKAAVPFANYAARTGYKDATFLYHRAMIERGVGNTARARELLTEALKLNPRFSPLQAPLARRILAALNARPTA
ncbi:tetratricopeptide repeat protein [Actinopolymorpha cephalotaxi]|uniref:Tetratricopeptide (TPR) repeat protein n=1 Tax=Actinopolymorpha cephalotaxi TaxID=504797 RepID=A0ABX2S8D0_9ACTN|nr:tetratricopeptide repeat protein [Actinopolymorpha cephalotaxi]NYH85898.1 tetratricopeptide (TPR) repeat protein [Actinopolymorpha cephalotaxi]